jgi:putative membrane protein
VLAAAVLRYRTLEAAMWHGMDSFGWGLGMLFMVLFWVAIVLLIVWLVRAISGRSPDRPHPLPPSETPLEILQKRYARGEIDRAEFEEKRRDLS